MGRIFLLMKEFQVPETSPAHPAPAGRIKMG